MGVLPIEAILETTMAATHREGPSDRHSGPAILNGHEMLDLGAISAEERVTMHRKDAIISFVVNIKMQMAIDQWISK